MTSENRFYDDLVIAQRGLVIAIPVSSIEVLGGLVEAVFLQQAAFLSALKRRSGGDGFFDFPMTGQREPYSSNIFRRLGSWEALGIKRHALERCRNRTIALGLLEEKRAGIPARLHYRVDSRRYAEFMAECGRHEGELLLGENAETASGNQDCRKPQTGSQEPEIKTSEATPQDCGGQRTIPESYGESPENQKTQRDRLIDLLIRQGVDQLHAEEWLRIRSSQRVVTTENTIQLIEREATNAGFSLASAIKHCALRGWKGFDPSWMPADKTASEKTVSTRHASFRVFEADRPARRSETEVATRRIADILKELK